MDYSAELKLDPFEKSDVTCFSCSKGDERTDRWEPLLFHTISAQDKSEVSLCGECLVKIVKWAATQIKEQP